MMRILRSKFIREEHSDRPKETARARIYDYLGINIFQRYPKSLNFIKKTKRNPRESCRDYFI